MFLQILKYVFCFFLLGFGFLMFFFRIFRFGGTWGLLVSPFRFFFVFFFLCVASVAFVDSMASIAFVAFGFGGFCGF